MDYKRKQNLAFRTKSEFYNQAHHLIYQSNQLLHRLGLPPCTNTRSCIVQLSQASRISDPLLYYDIYDLLVSLKKKLREAKIRLLINKQNG